MQPCIKLLAMGGYPLLGVTTDISRFFLALLHFQILGTFVGRGNLHDRKELQGRRIFLGEVFVQYGLDFVYCKAEILALVHRVDIIVAIRQVGFRYFQPYHVLVFDQDSGDPLGTQVK